MTRSCHFCRHYNEEDRELLPLETDVNHRWSFERFSNTDLRWTIYRITCHQILILVGVGFILALYNVVGCQVRSPIGNNYHFGNHVDSGNFAFTTTEAGDYTACFSVLEQKPSITVTIDFEWRSGVADRDWYKVAKKDKIEVSLSSIVLQCSLT